jgi:hypothetical protein
MKVWRWTVVVVASLFTGCASYMPHGSLYTGLKLPMNATSNGTATKKGTSQATSILGLVATGDASIEAAKKNGGITKITHVDWHAENYLGFYGKYVTTVYGE